MKINFNRSTLAALTLFATFSLANARDFRELTNLEGKKIKAELLDLNDGKLKIRANSRVFEMPLDKLSSADQDFIVEWDAQKKGTTDELYYKEQVFADDFSSEDFGEQWKHYKGESVIEDGVMIGRTIDIKEHVVLDSVKFEGRRDLQVSLKFKFAGPDAKSFTVRFADTDCKEVHAGHIIFVNIAPTKGSILDGKTGAFRKDIFDKKKAGEELDDATKEMLKTKKKFFELDFEDSKDQWHDLVVRTKADQVFVFIDEKEVGSFQSEGLAHETKSAVSLLTYDRGIHYDDLEIKAAPNTSENK
ncbi:MAG: hypothetical protein L3J39_11050 [Verrucomicrobiales bacterium]|nr:hypothetical protein [Verrucomicrobiales bacterium]